MKTQQKKAVDASSVHGGTRVDKTFSIVDFHKNVSTNGPSLLVSKDVFN